MVLPDVSHRRPSPAACEIGDYFHLSDDPLAFAGTLTDGHTWTCPSDGTALQFRLIELPLPDNAPGTEFAWERTH